MHSRCFISIIADSVHKGLTRWLVDQKLRPSVAREAFTWIALQPEWWMTTVMWPSDVNLRRNVPCCQSYTMFHPTWLLQPTRYTYVIEYVFSKRMYANVSKEEGCFEALTARRCFNMILIAEAPTRVPFESAAVKWNSCEFIALCVSFDIHWGPSDPVSVFRSWRRFSKNQEPESSNTTWLLSNYLHKKHTVRLWNKYTRGCFCIFLSWWV